MSLEFAKKIEISNITKAVYLFRENPQFRSIEGISNITVNLEKKILKFEGGVSLEMYNGEINFNIVYSEYSKVS